MEEKYFEKANEILTVLFPNKLNNETMSIEELGEALRAVKMVEESLVLTAKKLGYNMRVDMINKKTGEIV